MTAARSGIGPTCPACRTVHGRSSVAVGRFDPAGVHGYRASTGGPVRSTRAKANADYCATTRSRFTAALPSAAIAD